MYINLCVQRNVPNGTTLFNGLLIHNYPGKNHVNYKGTPPSSPSLLTVSRTSIMNGHLKQTTVQLKMDKISHIFYPIISTVRTSIF